MGMNPDLLTADFTFAAGMYTMIGLFKISASTSNSGSPPQKPGDSNRLQYVCVIGNEKCQSFVMFVT
jgi:hypothetical protein|tara:strand:- start:556 stop:756 length:201 start_codon:yes stop_codon:yes gene_type:complete